MNAEPAELDQVRDLLLADLATPPLLAVILRAALAAAAEAIAHEPADRATLAYPILLQFALNAVATQSSPPPPPPGPRRPLPDLGLPLAEFLATSGADTHPARVLAVAYWTYHRKGGIGFITTELVEAYRNARTSRPMNFPDVVATCMRRGWLTDGQRRERAKSWVITRTGETAFESPL